MLIPVGLEVMAQGAENAPIFKEEKLFPPACADLLLYYTLFFISVYVVAWGVRWAHGTLWKGAEAPPGAPWKGALLGLALAALYFIGLELALGHFLKSFASRESRSLYQPHPSLIWKLKPGIGKAVRGSMQVFTNSKGLRDYEIPVKREPGEFRILCLGDSWTFAQGVSLDESYEKQLEGLLKEKYPGKKITVINGGVQGYTIIQGLHFFKETGLDYEPNLVTLGFFHNDSRSYWARDRERISGNPLVKGLQSILYKSKVYMFLRQEISSRAAPGSSSLREEMRTPPEDYAEELEAFVRLGEEKGIRMVFLNLPLNRKVPGRESLLTRIVHKKGLDFIDVEKEWNESSETGLYLDFDPMHPSAKGHRKIARQMFNFIIARGYLEPGR